MKLFLREYRYCIRASGSQLNWFEPIADLKASLMNPMRSNTFPCLVADRPKWISLKLNDEVPYGVLSRASARIHLGFDHLETIARRLRSAILAISFTVVEDTLLAGEVTVDLDSGEGSLRQVLAEAVQGETITFAESLDGATIVLSGETLILQSKIHLNASNLGQGITIDANYLSRVVEVREEAHVTLENLKLINGGEEESDVVREGGGIFNGGQLLLRRCTLANHSATRAGGIWNEGVLRVEDCTISENYGENGSGGIHNVGRMEVRRSTLSRNQSPCGSGGALFNRGGQATMINCTVACNFAGDDGAGGGLCNDGELTLISCTVSGNQADGLGGGIFHANGGVFGPSPSSSLMLANCIVVGNKGEVGDDPSHTVEFNVHNQGVMQEEGVNLLRKVDESFGTSVLAPLGDYGGWTQTMPPLPGNLVIDAGIAQESTPVTDQRGLTRIVDAGLDLGAYETGNAAGYEAWVLETFGRTKEASFDGDANRNGIPNGVVYACGPGEPLMPLAAGPEGQVRIRFGMRSEAEREIVWRVFRSRDLKQFSEIFQLRHGRVTLSEPVLFEKTDKGYVVVDRFPSAEVACDRLEVERIDAPLF